MKLSQLTPEQKTCLLAELDGWTQDPTSTMLHGFKKNLEFRTYFDFNYLTHYDAIIPLIQKLKITQEMELEFEEYGGFCFNATPSQLCDAVLVATGRAEL